MDRILNGGRALDLGCGAGRESLFLAQHGYEVEAVDKDSAHVEQLDARAREGNLPLKALNLKIEKFEILPHNYSLIIARHSLSFIPDLPTVMSVIKNMVGGLKSEGMVCFTLFGNRDGWTGRADMSFFEYEPVIALLKSLPLCLYYRSSEEYSANTVGGVRKSWHVHTFCYFKKPVSNPHLLDLLR